MQKLYDELMSLEGVIEVEILDDWQGKAAVYVCGGDANSIGKIISGNTYWWSYLLGDTEALVYGFKTYFYRDKQAFRAKFKELFGKEFDQCSLS